MQAQKVSNKWDSIIRESKDHITNWNSYTNIRIQLSKRNFIIFSLERPNTALSCRIQAKKSRPFTQDYPMITKLQSLVTPNDVERAEAVILRKCEELMLPSETLIKKFGAVDLIDNPVL